MLEIIKDELGNIKACLEWYLVNEQGEYDNKGEFVWVNDCEISPQYRNNGLLKEFIKVVIKKVPPNAKFGYFWRMKKYPDRKPRIYHKSKWLRLINGGKDV